MLIAICIAMAISITFIVVVETFVALANAMRQQRREDVRQLAEEIKRRRGWVQVESKDQS